MIRTPALIKKKKGKIKSATSIRNIDSPRVVDNTSPVERIRRRKKIRATEDFNHLNRPSLAFDWKPAMPDQQLLQVKMNTRKIQEYNYLPKVLLDEKENAITNCAPLNVKEKKSMVVKSSSSSISGEEATPKKHVSKKETLLEINFDEAQGSFTGKFDEENVEIKCNKLGRKSVRFLSPRENTEKKRNTFEIEKPSTDIDLLLSINEDDGTPKLRQSRKNTPHVKHIKENISDITKKTLEYSSNSDSDDVFEDPIVHNEVQLVDKETENVQERDILNQTFDGVSEDVLHQTHRARTTVKFEKAPVSILRKSSVMKTRPESPIASYMEHESIQSPVHKKHLPEAVIPKLNSMTPNKFGTKNKSLIKNVHRSMTDLKNKTPDRLLKHGLAAENLDKTPNITKSKLTLFSKTDDGMDKGNGVSSPLQSKEEFLNITLNISDQSLLGICFNSTRKTLRRSSSSPAVQNSDEINSPITISSTPSSSIINLISPRQDSPSRKTLNPLVRMSAVDKSFGSLPEKLNDMPKTNSTRKRWNKSVDLEILDCSGNTVVISSPWKSNNVQVPLNNLSVGNDKKERKSKSPLMNNSIKKTKPSTRKKMPNFALIHQMAFDKMENLQELTERKAARALQLLSGKKPEERRQLRSPKCRKPLKYSPTIATRQRKSPPQANSNTKVDKSKSAANVKGAKISKPVQKKAEQPKMKTNVLKAVPKEQNKKPLSRLGFKVDVQPVKCKDKDELKAAATRTSVIKNTVDTRRNAVLNIRSNRRFELLMKMRAKK